MPLALGGWAKDECGMLNAEFRASLAARGKGRPTVKPGPAGSGSVSRPGTKRGGTPLEPAAGTAAAERRPRIGGGGRVRGGLVGLMVRRQCRFRDPRSVRS
jgi:hypothetical protein